MRSLLVPLLALAAVVCAQPGPQITAQHMRREGAVIRAAGRVEIKLGSVTLRGDEGTLNPDTGEADVRGRAEIVLPARTDHTLFRYDRGALVTDKLVELFADHLHVKNMILEGSGHIRVRTPDERLMADGVEMFLTNADGHVSGNVLSSRSRGASVNEWNPEIIKQ